MRHFARHQEAQRLFHARVVGQRNQALVDDLGARLGRNIRTQVGARLGDRVDVGGSPWHAGRIGQRGARAVQHLGQVAVVAGAGDAAVHVGFGLDRFGQLALGALVEHGDDVADHFQVAQLFGCDVEQHVLAAWIVFRHGLGEVAHGGRQLALGTTELLEHEVRQSRVGPGDTDCVLQAFVMCKHSDSSDR